MLPQEKVARCRQCVQCDESTGEVTLGGNKKFTFDHALAPETAQEQVFQRCVRPLVDGCFDGYNATVFAYGQTGSGKTFTMGSGGDHHVSVLAATGGTSGGLGGGGSGGVGGGGRGLGSVDGGISGSIGGAEDGSDLGIIPRSIERIFALIGEATDPSGGGGRGGPGRAGRAGRVERAERAEWAEYLVRVSFLEIYQESVRDLLHPETPSKEIAIREAADGSILVAGAKEAVVTSAADTHKLLRQGAVVRTTGSTLMNEQSSRSHAIFTIIIEQRRQYDSTSKAGAGAGFAPPSPSGNASPEALSPESEEKKDRDHHHHDNRSPLSSPPAQRECTEEYTRAKFHLVDLAGSERNKRTRTEGKRFREGVRINEGLLALGNVISALGDRSKWVRHPKSGQLAPGHVPYRDSKLTRLLQDSLGGNARTLMIACVSPADANFSESLSVLKYANRARNIKNRPKVNDDPDAGRLAQLQQEVQALQDQLRRAQEQQLRQQQLQGEVDNCLAALAAKRRHYATSADPADPADGHGGEGEADTFKFASNSVSAAAAAAAAAAAGGGRDSQDVRVLREKLREAHADLDRDEQIFAKKMVEMRGLQQQVRELFAANEALRVQLAACDVPWSQALPRLTQPTSPPVATRRTTTTNATLKIAAQATSLFSCTDININIEGARSATTTATTMW
eukprot:g6670.t1